MNTLLNIPFIVDDEVQNLGKVIALAIEPFIPMNVLVFLSDDSRFDRTIQVVVGNIPKYPFTLLLTDRMLISYDGRPFELLYQKIYEHFRNRPILPVDDHIVLGEE